MSAPNGQDQKKSRKVERAPVVARPTGAAPVGSRRRVLRPESPLVRSAKVAGVLAAVCIMVGIGLYQRTRAQVTEGMMEFGATMMHVVDARRQDEPRELVLNGESVHFASGTSDRSTDELLDYFEERCDTRDGGISEAVVHAATEHAARGHQEEGEQMLGVRPLVRHADENGGFIACLDMGERELGIGEVLDRARTFDESRDLHDFGDLRYVFVRPLPDGGTHFVAFWTEGSFRFDRVFPETGDAVGEDPADIPRPPGARRRLVAYETGDSERATIYTGSELDDAALERFYRRELSASGWNVLDSEGSETVDRLRADSLEAGVRPALVAMRGDRTVYVSLSSDREGRGRAGIVTVD